MTFVPHSVLRAIRDRCETAETIAGDIGERVRDVVWTLRLLEASGLVVCTVVTRDEAGDWPVATWSAA